MMGSFEIGDWRGRDVVSAEGEKLGKLEDVYYDGDTEQAAFLCVRTGRFGHNQTLVPADQVQVSPETVTVPWAKDVVDNAPTTKPDEELSLDDEQQAFRHYGLDYTPPMSPGQRRLVRR